MNTLIIYMSHHGTTAKIARYMQKHLPGNTDLVDLGTTIKVNLQPYDRIIIGGSIHGGKIQPDIQIFCNQFMDQLTKKQVGLFICCMHEEKAVEQFDRAFPLELREHAVAKGIMGGEFLFEKMNFLEKFAIRTLAREKKSISSINYDNANLFIGRISDGNSVQSEI